MSKLRLTCLISIFFQVLSVSACRSQRTNARGGEQDRIELGQNVTVNARPEDIAFKDFSKNWRQFVSTSPQLSATVIGKTKREPTPPEPVIFSECVYNADAKGYVPQVTITWNEAPSQTAAAPGRDAQQVAPALRFDLALHHDPFGRNYFSSALSTDKLKRFTLPSNSGLVNNPEAVMLTGPGLFPKLMDFRTESLQDAATNRQFSKNTIVLRDVSPGLSYTMRVSRLTGNAWNEDRQVVFLPPVCPNSF
jgi:hypothetical protein